MYLSPLLCLKEKALLISIGGFSLLIVSFTGCLAKMVIVFNPFEVTLGAGVEQFEISGRLSSVAHICNKIYVKHVMGLIQRR